MAQLVPMLIVSAIMMAVSYGIQVAFAPSPAHTVQTSTSLQEGARLSDLSVQTANYGAAIPVVWGSMRFAGTVLWSNSIKEVATTQTTVTTITSSSGGGKGGKGGGGSSESTMTEIQVTYTYYITMAVGLCHGPLQAVRRVWANSKLVVDLTPENTGLKYKYSDSIYQMYLGLKTQGIDPTMESFQPDDTPAYRDWAYMVLTEFPLADFGNSIPQYTFEVVSQSPSINLVSLVQGGFGPSNPAGYSISSYASQQGGGLGAAVCGNKLYGVNKCSGEFSWVYDPTGVVINGITGWMFMGEPLIVGNTIYVGIYTGNNYQFYQASFDLVTGVATGASALLVAGVRYPGWGDSLPLYFIVGGFMAIDSQLIPVSANHVMFKIGSSVYAPNNDGALVSCTGVTSIYGVATTYKLRSDGFIHSSVIKVSASGIVEKEPTEIALDAGINIFSYDQSTRYDTMPGQVVGGWLDLDTGHMIIATQDSTHFGRGGLWRVDPNTWQVVACTQNTYGLILRGSITAGSPTMTDIVDSHGDPLVVLTEQINRFANPGGNMDSSKLNVFIASLSNDGRSVTFNQDFDVTSLSAIVQIEDAVWANGLDISSCMNAPTLNTRLHTNTYARMVTLSTQDFSIRDSTPISACSYINCTGSFLSHYFYDSYMQSGYSSYGGIYRYNTGLASSGATSLGSVVSWLSNQVGMANLDVSELTDTFNGWFLPKQASVRACLDQLKACYLFDACESDGRIAYRKRTHPSVYTIPFADICFKLEGAKEANMLQEVRQQEIEIPRRLTVRYANSDNAYQAGAQIAQRMTKTNESRGDMSFDSPLAMTDSVAATMATRMLGCAWTERTIVDVKLPPKYMCLDPTDTIIIEKIDRSVNPADGAPLGTLTYICVRLVEVSLVEGYIVHCKGVVTNSVSYDEYVEIQGGYYPSAPAYDSSTTASETDSGSSLLDANGNYINEHANHAQVGAPVSISPTPRYANPIPVDAQTRNYTNVVTSGSWAANKAYTMGTLVAWLGSAYQNISAGKSVTVSTTWASSTLFKVGDTVAKDGGVYLCKVGGTSGATGPTGTSTYINVTDGTAQWLYTGSYGPTGTGTSIFDNTCKWQYVGVADGSGASGSSDTSNTDTGIAFTLPTTYFLLNLPNFGQANDVGGFWMVAGPQYSAGTSKATWPGAVIYRSADNATWSSYTSSTSAGAFGIVHGTLPPPQYGWAGWDSTTSLVVYWNDDYGFTRRDDLSVLNGGNAILVGDEVIQFVNVEFIDGNPRRTRFTRLLRGRCGTDYAIYTHTAGERCIALEPSTMVYCSSSLETGLPRYYRGASAGGDVTTAATVKFINTSAGLKPYSPVQIKAAQDISGNRTLTWIRRTRERGGWADSVDVAEAERNESYDLEYWNGGAVVRTVTGYVNNTGTTPTQTYSATNYAIDYPGGLVIPIPLVDPGGESSLQQCWLNTTGSWLIVADPTGGAVTPHGGAYVFASGAGGPNVLSQTVSLIPIVNVDDLYHWNDQGTPLNLTIEGYTNFYGTHSDAQGQLIATFLDFAGNEVGSISTTLQNYASGTTWVHISASGPIPVDTRFVKVSLYAVRTTGYGNIMMDDVSVSVTAANLAQVVIYEKSATVGRGFPGSAVI